MLRFANYFDEDTFTFELKLCASSTLTVFICLIITPQSLNFEHYKFPYGGVAEIKSQQLSYVNNAALQNRIDTTWYCNTKNAFNRFLSCFVVQSGFK